MQLKNNIYKLSFLITFVVFMVCQNSIAQKYQPKMKSIYHKGWIDLNKHGVIDIYEDPNQPTEKRIDDLLSKM
jgi:beta-glucosidase